MLKSRNNSIIIMVILTVLLLAIINIPCYADMSILLSPPINNITVDPGVERVCSISLSNEGSNLLRFKVIISPVIQQLDGQFKPTNENEELSAIPWISSKIQNEVITKPGGSGTLEFKVKAPRGATGTRAAAIILELQPDPNNLNDKAFGQSIIKQRFLSLLIITVNNRANQKKAAIKEFQIKNGATDGSLSTFGKKAIAFECSVENTGNVLLQCQGRLTIRNLAGRRIWDVPLGDGVSLAVPKATINLVSVFPKGLDNGDYTAEIFVQFGGSRLLQAKTPFSITKEQTSAGSLKNVRTLQVDIFPEVVQAQLPAGSYRIFVISLTNSESKPVKFQGVINSPYGEGQTPAFSATKWLSLESDSIVIGPNEKKNVRITCKVPKDTPDGSWYANLIYEVVANEPKEKGPVTTITTPLVVRVGKNIAIKAELLQPGIVQADQTGNAWLVGGVLANQGNTHLTNISGKVTLKKRPIVEDKGNKTNKDQLNFIGQGIFTQLAVLDIEPAEEWLLPGQSRLTCALYNKPLEPGEYQADIYIDFGSDTPIITRVNFMVTATNKK